jgi:acetyl esterase/lipase
MTVDRTANGIPAVNAPVAPARYLPPPPATVRADGSRHHVGVTYAVAFGFRPLQLDVWVPDGPRPPLVVWIHGGAWLFGDRRYLPETLRPDQLFDALLARGLAVASIDYRHSHEAKFPAQLHDCKAAIRYLRHYADALGVDTARIGVWGESAGGHLAALLALTGRRSSLEGELGVLGPSSAVDVCVDWYGPSDLEAIPERSFPPEIAAILPLELTESPEEVLLAGLDAATRRDSAPVSHVRAGSPPFLLVHGSADRVVPLEQSEQLAAALVSAGGQAELVVVPGADHIFAGHADVDGLVNLSADYLAAALSGVRVQG